MSEQRRGKRKLVNNSVQDDRIRKFKLNDSDWLLSWNRLYPFQKKCIKFATRRSSGRLIIGDEMGCGKTIESILIYLFYCIQDRYLETGKKMMLVVPSSLRDQWFYELVEWIPFLARMMDHDQEEPEHPIINVVRTGSQSLNGKLIDIISYALARKKKEEILKQKYEMIIIDECHKLKNHKSLQTKSLMLAMKRSTRLILLSGTLILSKPCELYAMLNALGKEKWRTMEAVARDFSPYPIPCDEGKLFDRWSDFTTRYCNGHRGQFGWDTSGSSNIEELNHVLKHVMIRRRKCEVLTELPEKIRSRIRIPLSKRSISQVNKQMDGLKKLYNKSAGRSIQEKLAKMYEYQHAFMELFRKNSQVKMKPINDYIRYYMDENCSEDADLQRHLDGYPPQKILLFAHHIDMLDSLQEMVLQWMEKRLDKTGQSLKCIRIDGKTPGHHRSQFVDAFQNDDSVRVAILSITAAGVGLNMTAASHVLFAEMYWNPAAMLQAEDRTHRIGQTDICHISYLIGMGSFDERMWRILDRKMCIVTEVLDGIKNQKLFDPNLIENWENVVKEESEEEESEEEESKECQPTHTRLSRCDISDIMIELLGLPDL
jgi:SNF2 family DNA or RNA helicase